MKKWLIIGGVALVGYLLWQRSRTVLPLIGAALDADRQRALQGPSSLKAELAPSSQTLDITSGAQGVPLQPPKLSTQVGMLGPSSLQVRDVGFGSTGAFR